MTSQKARAHRRAHHIQGRIWRELDFPAGTGSSSYRASSESRRALEHDDTSTFARTPQRPSDLWVGNPIPLVAWLARRALDTASVSADSPADRTPPGANLIDPAQE